MGDIVGTITNVKNFFINGRGKTFCETQHSASADNHTLC